MCTYKRQFDVYVSGMIQGRGRWEECDILVNLWKEANARIDARRQHHDDDEEKTRIYLDVGGNIGSCVMEMLMSTDANIVVLEPHPHNLAQLTTTLMAQTEDNRNRVRVVPVGAGNTTEQFPMHIATDNRGNSVMNVQIKDTPSQNFLDPTTVYVERIDDIIDASKVIIPLVKMDIQGFECRALDGMPVLLSNAIDTFTGEMADNFLRPQGCSAQGMKQRLEQHGFVVSGDYNIVAHKQYGDK
jgi:FkbM family methyltransferase